MPESEHDAPAGLPAPAAALLPHRRPVRLIDTLQVVDGRSGRADASIPDNPLFIAPDAVLDPTAHLELIAQTFCFPPAFNAFEGHFPGNPVLPAFAQVRTVVSMLASAGQEPAVLERIDRGKFRLPLRPDQQVQVRCRLEEGVRTRRASASLTAGDRIVSSFQATVRTHM